jgi:Tfp pilus assembly protein PilP
MGLIRRYKGAYLGENAGYVLMIGDDEENAEVIENAKEIIQ